MLEKLGLRSLILTDTSQRMGFLRVNYVCFQKAETRNYSGKHLGFYNLSETLKMSSNYPHNCRFEAGYLEILSSKSGDGKIIKNREGKMPPSFRANGEAEAMNLSLSSQSCTVY